MAARDYVTGELFVIARCPSCDVSMTAPVPASLDRYYPMRYRRFSALAEGVLRAFYSWRVRGWLGRLERPGKALEIGCGDGWMLDALRRGWRVVGIERSVPAARVASADRGLPVFVGGLEAIRASACFDLIVMFHVLEHLFDPVGTLRACAALLRPGGHIVLALPNSSSWQSRLTGSDWMHLDVPRHLWHFSPGALRTALERAGLRTERFSFVSPEHDPYGWVQSGLNRLGFQQNVLTKLIFGLDLPPPASVLVRIGVAMLPLSVAAVILSLMSWLLRAGAIVEVWASRPAAEP